MHFGIGGSGLDEQKRRVGVTEEFDWRLTYTINNRDHYHVAYRVVVSIDAFRMKKDE